MPWIGATAHWSGLIDTLARQAPAPSMGARKRPSAHSIAR